MLARMARIAIIGGGSIGEALLSGMLRAGRQVKDLVVAEKDPGRSKYLSETYSVLVTTVGDAVDTATYAVTRVAKRAPAAPPTPRPTDRSEQSTSDSTPWAVLALLLVAAAAFAVAGVGARRRSRARARIT